MDKELSSSDEVAFKEFPKQKEFFEAVTGGEYKFIMFGGAIRGGKTLVSLATLLALCKIYPRSKWIVVRKSLQRIKDTVLPTFYNLRPDSFTAQDPSQGNSWEWVSTNDSMIKFYAENIEKDPELKRFRGLEADGFLFEEMDIVEKTFFVGFERTGTWLMKERKEAKERGEAVPPSIIIGTSNPQGGWVKELIYDKWVRKDLNPKWHYIQSRVYDNPSVSEEWIQSQRDNLTPERFELMINGDWTASDNPNSFFFHFDEGKHKGHDKKVDGEHMLTLGFDFNFSPVSCLKAQKIEGVGCFFYKEYFQKEGGTESLCDEQLTEIRDGDYLMTITGDNNGHSNKDTAQKLSLTDYTVIEKFFKRKVSPATYRANASHEFSREICNHLLKTVPCYFDGDGCPVLIQDMKEAEATDKGKLNKKKKDSHIVDCFRYVVNQWFDSVKEINQFAARIEHLQEINKQYHEEHREEVEKKAAQYKVRLKR